MWIDLNKTHKKSFEKEICLFKAMDKEQYKFHGYVEQFTEEMTLLFKGKSDGSFELIINRIILIALLLNLRTRIWLRSLKLYWMGNQRIKKLMMFLKNKRFITQVCYVKQLPYVGVSSVIRKQNLRPIL